MKVWPHNRGRNARNMEELIILTIDPHEADRSRIELLLGGSYRHRGVATLEAGLEVIRAENPHCILLASPLPEGRGQALVDQLRDAEGQLPAPVILLTKMGDLEAGESGAHQQLAKDRLEAEAVRLAVSGARLQVDSERQAATQRQEVERLLNEARAQNAALVKAKEDLERANAAKDQFLAKLSHELRTPLNPVLSLVSSSSDDPGLSPDLRETFAIIRRNVQLEARLIDDLLDLTRVLQGRLEIQKQPLDLHACLRAALDLCQPDFTSRKIGLWTALHAAHSKVTGDFSRLQQVLWNLFRNAVQYTPDGGRVEITTANEGETIVLEIRDTGTGIPVERLGEIFEAFHRADEDVSPFGQLGLGLSVGRAVIEAHGGQLTARSDGSGRGAVFTVTLPVEIAVPEVAAASPAPAPAKRGLTVLVVEDHEDTRRVLARALRRKGFGVTAAASVAGALEEFHQRPTDLVICDIGLPDGTGWDFVSQLREEGPVRAVAVSGYGMERDIQRSRDAGFAAHIVKPVDFSQLEKVVSRLLAEPLS